MGMLLYGFKNIYRNKLRTFIVFFLISLPFFSVLMMVAMKEGIDFQITKVKKNIGNLIQVKPKGAFGTVNIAGGLNRSLPEKTVDQMRTIEHVTRVEPYLTAIEPIAGYYMTLHIGVRPGDRKTLGSHGEVGNPKIILGRDFTETDNGQDVAIVGKEYAKMMGIDPEEFSDETFFVKEVLRPGPGLVKEGLKSIGGNPFKVIGIFESGYDYGDHQMYIPYDTFRKYYGMKDRVSSVYVTVDSLDHMEQVAEKIREKLGNRVDVVTQESGARFVSRALGTIEKISNIWILLSLLLMILILLFSMLLAIDQRYKEIGTLKALGAGTVDLAKQYVMESVALSLLGGVTGTIFFKLLASSIGKAFFTSIYYVYLPGQYGQSLFENLTIPYSFSGKIVLFILIVSLLTGCASSLYAVLRASRLSPMETIGHV
ncbi:MAG: ABC transporter permease [Planctomycetota bacterium]|jgi:putative ABC transport system permease protein